MIFIKRTRKAHWSSDKHRNCYKDNVGETSEPMDFSERIDTILNWTKMSLSCVNVDCLTILYSSLRLILWSWHRDDLWTCWIKTNRISVECCRYYPIFSFTHDPEKKDTRKELQNKEKKADLFDKKRRVRMLPASCWFCQINLNPPLPFFSFAFISLFSCLLLCCCCCCCCCVCVRGCFGVYVQNAKLCARVIFSWFWL